MNLSIKNVRKMLDSGEISCVELTKKVIDNAKKTNEKFGAFNLICEELALTAAKNADEKIAKHEAGPLTGVPFSAKDNICVKGIKTTCSSKLLENFVPPYTATVIEKLEKSGAVMVGKCSMDEFAMGSTGQNSPKNFPKPKNPYDLSHVSGGSSGGSAVSVAANLCSFSLGSDTGGSVRQPASFCGVSGIKPTYGAVSRYGLIAYASSLDQIGVISNSAADSAAVLNIISGQDKNDQTSQEAGSRDYAAKIGMPISGLKVAIPKEFFSEGIDDEVKTSVLEAAKIYEKNGAKLVDSSLPSFKYGVSAYYVLACSEASSNLARFDGVRFGLHPSGAKSYEKIVQKSRSEGFGAEVKRRILLGNYALSSGYYDAYYVKALAIRQQIMREYAKIFEAADVVLVPTAPTTAYKCDENLSDAKKMYAADICTVTANIAGIPAISTTCGYGPTGLPIGMSIFAPKFADDVAIAAADFFEQNFERREPQI
jgi:aspartyl-tRNA(Asn)/glutamyl-tRNA(Gln) amidotransferase subunit A